MDDNFIVQQQIFLRRSLGDDVVFLPFIGILYVDLFEPGDIACQNQHTGVAVFIHRNRGHWNAQARMGSKDNVDLLLADRYKLSA